MRVLYIVNGYPTKKHPEYCVFTKEQIDSIRLFNDIESDLIFINARERGWRAYLENIPLIFDKASDCDIIHCFHGLTFILVCLIIPKKKILVSFLNEVDKEFSESGLSNFFVFLTNILLKKKYVYKIFKNKRSKVFDDRTFFLPNGVDMNFFINKGKEFSKSILGLDLNKKYLLFVSSKSLFRKQKRYDLFLETLRILKSEYNLSDISELTLVGQQRYFIPYYMSAADVHLLCSDYEGSPNSVKEAMACDLAVVARDVGDVADLLRSDNRSFVVDTSDPHKLANCVFKVLSDVDNLDSVSRKILEEKGYDMRSKAEELRLIYYKICD